MIELTAALLIILAFLFLFWCVRKKRIGIFLMVLGGVCFLAVTGLKYGSEAFSYFMDELGESGMDLMGFKRRQLPGVWTEQTLLWQILAGGTAAAGLLLSVWEAFRNR